MDAREWKAFYDRERGELGERSLEELVERAPKISWPSSASLIFPHTRLVESGAYTAAAARAVVEAGADRVLALGVLHQARREDAEVVARARAGDADALATLRRVHGPDIEDDRGMWTDEYSLDNFAALVEVAGRVLGRRPPEVIRRFPFLVGDSPSTLTGIDELFALVRSGCALVATTDPVHHGTGYGTPREQRRPRESHETVAFARGEVERGFALAAKGDYAAFAAHAASVRSDFRDNGPVLATLLGPPLSFEVKDITLVDYAPTLNAEEPTWVAATLSAFWK
jgi:hypothetical protein